MWPEIPIMSEECFNKDRKFSKSSKCLDSEEMLKWGIVRDECLVKSLMSWCFKYIGTR